MTAETTPRTLVLADDLTGATEAAIPFADRVGGVRLHLGTQSIDATSAGTDVVDLHTRGLDDADARAAVEAALDGVGDEVRVIAKVDSLLRGRLAAHVAALAGHRPVVVALGVPSTGRAVREGVVHVGDVALHETTLWAAEPSAAPTSVTEALGDIPSVVVAAGESVGSDLADALRSGAVAICDVETDADLDHIVSATDELGPVCLVGTASLALAVARRMPAHEQAVHPTPASRPVLVAAGTADSIRVPQVRALVDAGAAHRELDADDLLADVALAPAIAAALAAHDVVVVTVGGAIRPEASARISQALADVVAAVDHARPSHLVLTGGATARAVVDAVGITDLSPLDAVETGAVVSLAGDGSRLVATKPGSFGDAHTLLALVRRMQVIADTASGPSALVPHQEGSPMTVDLTSESVSSAEGSDGHLPVVAVTMGDAAGVGPEVVVAALLDDRALAWCRPVVIGDLGRLRAAADVLGLEPEFVTVDVEDVATGPTGAGRICVVDLGLIPADLPWGQLSSVAGDAAYQYIRVASELAVTGAVQAICTAPLNKEALHAAGHIYPGHTELLAHLTGTEEVSMMLSTPKLRVIHVTTHIGLLDAVARIEPGLVERTIRRGHEALQRSGLREPVIGVCGINP
ncbi:MAG: 4-hydroxythreonine-4-phosphate dehydrogenase PdxA, partial [Williamsia herbipolensis]|nr:4-hydroxythreonine-4-phosphate dehydrogenase PdxA [Williamsia herbipolensis]